MRQKVLKEYKKTVKLKNLYKELNNLQEELNYKTNELELVYNSQSWKTTKPLRKIVQFILPIKSKRRETCKIYLQRLKSLIKHHRYKIIDLNSSITQVKTGGYKRNRTKKLCLFAHFDKQKKIDPYVVYYLKCIHNLGFEIKFISTVEDLNDKEINKIINYCSQIILRKNIGFDFGSWATGLKFIDNLELYDTFLLTNDSVYGPFHDLKKIFKKMEKSNLDMWGLVDSYQIAHHIQSYFLVCNRRTINKLLNNFFNKFKSSNVWEDMIEYYEIGISQFLIKNGCRIGAFCDYKNLAQHTINKYKDFYYTNLFKEGFKNPTHVLWKILIEDFDFPFVKIRLLRYNPARIVNVNEWKEVIKKTGYDTRLIEKNLNRIK